ncbi:MAG: Hsp20/alpha crystallin family protein [Proteobacteria bacterium]|nr:Hsp20/alpha crystallin family protein [Desulfobacula sp.]MBU3952913.1 Hsp20/alpha crystallin family protein [Pseudomonadota bacterium]MBU4129442.1 Hsp20/alpha crystallin family protein [Pseudomonadota bacterium]
MRLVRYNPLNELALLRNSFTDFFTDSAPKAESQDWSPAVDIFDAKDSIVLMIDLPGVQKEDIRVNIEKEILTLSGERKPEIEGDKHTFYKRERIFGSFRRNFILSPELLTEEVDASFKEGVLKITLKKNKITEAAKQISIH